jgi:hypothetical protein
MENRVHFSYAFGDLRHQVERLEEIYRLLLKEDMPKLSNLA